MRATRLKGDRLRSRSPCAGRAPFPGRKAAAAPDGTEPPPTAPVGSIVVSVPLVGGAPSEPGCAQTNQPISAKIPPQSAAELTITKSAVL